MARQWATITLTDSYGRETRLTREMDDQTTLLDYMTEMTALAGKLANISDLGLVGTKFFVTGGDAATSPQAGANVDVGATFVGWGTGERADRKISTKVPGIKASKVDAQGNIDIEDVDVAAFLAEFTSSGDWKLSDGEKVGTWISGSLDR